MAGELLKLLQIPDHVLFGSIIFGEPYVSIHDMRRNNMPVKKGTGLVSQNPPLRAKVHPLTGTFDHEFPPSRRNAGRPSLSGCQCEILLASGPLSAQQPLTAREERSSYPSTLLPPQIQDFFAPDRHCVQCDM